MTDENAYVDAVLASGGFPARYRINGRELTRLYGSDETMRLYETLNDYYGDYMTVMELFGQLEAAWPEMIQKIAGGLKIKTVMKEENESLNKELEEVYGIHPIELDEEAG
jgi:2-hydroxy-3-keto-5-methylthiopentenyl-1-phosphate phosphatase